jgi:hypothetical protein
MQFGENVLVFDLVEAPDSPSGVDPASKDNRNLTIALRQIQVENTSVKDGK